MEMERELVRIINELLADSRPKVGRSLHKLLLEQTNPGVKADEYPEDLIAADVVTGDEVCLSMLGLLNTALVRSGSDKRLVATIDGGVLVKLELD